VSRAKASLRSRLGGGRSTFRLENSEATDEAGRFDDAFTGQENEPEVRRRLDAHNEAILDCVNRSGEIFLSHTRLDDRYTIRVCIGNPRQEMRHVHRCWELLQQAARSAGE